MKRINKSKKGALGEGILMIYRLIIVSFIALIIIGTSAIVYDFYIDVRDVEARIMAKQILDCVAPMGKIDLTKIPKDSEKAILSYCGFSDKEAERFYVELNIGGTILKQGDEGKKWVKQIFDYGAAVEGEVAKYEPGYFSNTYRLNGGTKKIKLKSLVAEV